MLFDTEVGLKLVCAFLMLVATGLVHRLERSTTQGLSAKLTAAVEAGSPSLPAVERLVHAAGRTLAATRAALFALILGTGWLAGPPLSAAIRRALFGPSGGAAGSVVAPIIAGVLLLAAYLLIHRLAGYASEAGALGPKDSPQGRTDRALAALRSRRAGLTGNIQREILEELFHFKERNVGALMTPKKHIAGLSSSMRNKEALDVVRQFGFTRYPVFDGEKERAIGIVHLRDVIDAAETAPRGSITDQMHSPVALPLHTPASAALKEMRARRAHLAVVVDEHGRTQGLVSLEDLLEEIVSERPDDATEEARADEEKVRPIADGVYEVDGDAMFVDVLQALMIDLDHAGFDTIAGYVFSRLGRKPLVGDVLSVGELEIDILQVEGGRATRLKVQRAKNAPPLSV